MTQANAWTIMTVITTPGEVVSVDIVQVKSLEGSVYGLAFIDHNTNMPFLHGMAKKNDFSGFSLKSSRNFGWISERCSKGSVKSQAPR
jgi:hypothetical protein